MLDVDACPTTIHNGYSVTGRTPSAERAEPTCVFCPRIPIFFQARRADAGGDRKEIVMSEHIPVQLPVRPSLEQLRKQAKDLLRKCRSGDVVALERLRRQKPEVTEPILADAQFALACEYGFASWPKLVASLALPADDPHRSRMA